MESSFPSLSFFVLLITSTIIATLGLLVDSPAVVIGAMIVAPLMNPILSCAFGISTSDGILIQRSLLTIVLGSCTVMLLAWALDEAVPATILSREIIARTTPNIVDLGIALAAGAAGAFSLTRPKIANSIAGVAIAVALVPPLCVAGIGLGLRDDIGVSVETVVPIGIGNQVTTGALLLFCANLIGITVAASLVFLWQRYGHWRRAGVSLVSLGLLLAVVSGPLSGAMGEFILEKRIDSQIAKLWERYPHYREVIQLKNLSVQTNSKGVKVDFQLYAPSSLLDDQILDQLHGELSQVLEKSGLGTVTTTIRHVPTEVRSYRSTLAP
ncbi:DUF389 domain-containing protein [Synechococcus sp. CCY9202]|uniref:DUF389 domain-containing protein n=1 Tax=Synechococcus sp. CCY9202 TaxID=174698 RepID=UPI002B20C569|nr:DUF389 domain-containing protein [Synechococcus sp. CCY9202]